MDINIYTWGTGGAFGRELGIIPKGRKRREHSSVSIIGMDKGSTLFHFMVDAGAPCVEKMIDRSISPCPELLFITHTHNDHISNFDKLVKSRERGINYNKTQPTPLNVISSPLCADDPKLGLKAMFGYFKNEVRFISVPCNDIWYCVQQETGKIIPSYAVDKDKCYPVEFKILPVIHGAFAPGSCMFIFRIIENGKRIVATGDFEAIEDRWIDNRDLKDPNLLLMEANTIKAAGTGHTNLQQNSILINHWLSEEAETKILLTHLSGYEDWEQKYYDHIPTDQDWLNVTKQLNPPGKASIGIAEDDMCYTI